MESVFGIIIIWAFFYWYCRGIYREIIFPQSWDSYKSDILAEFVGIAWPVTLVPGFVYMIVLFVHCTYIIFRDMIKEFWRDYVSR